MKTQDTEKAAFAKIENLVWQNKRYAKLRWGNTIGEALLIALKNITEQFQLSVANGDLLLLANAW